jgi:hypothetical protein
MSHAIKVRSTLAAARQHVRRANRLHASAVFCARNGYDEYAINTKVAREEEAKARNLYRAAISAVEHEMQEAM